jgi:Zn-dependent protease
MTDAKATDKTWLNGLLFVLTVLTTYVAGLIWSDGFSYGGAAFGDSGLAAFLIRVLRDPRLIPLGVSYSAALMTILVGHELGHYLTCRRYGLPATLPYFLPGPPFIGTFGAFIRIRSRIPYKRQLFDVGANGPLVGFALTLPALATGLALSRVAPDPLPGPGVWSFGEPLLFRLMAPVFFGKIPAGWGLVLHPIGWAGWVGLLVTAINLVPLGQFDGGHVAYAVLGRRARRVSQAMVAALAVLGVFFHVTWLIIAGVLLYFDRKTKSRLSHPPVFDEDAPLGARRRWLAALVVAIFVLSFIPDPVQGAGLIDILKGSWL